MEHSTNQGGGTDSRQLHLFDASTWPSPTFSSQHPSMAANPPSTQPLSVTPFSTTTTGGGTMALAPSQQDNEGQQVASAMNTNPMGLDLDEDEDEPSKRHAKKGQWQTPPMPIFPSSAMPGVIAPVSADPATATGTNGGAAAGSSSSGLTSSTDYAKALQEAYLRGAEAAAAMSQQYQGNAAVGGVGVAGSGVVGMSSFGGPAGTSTTSHGRQQYQQQQQQQTQHNPIQTTSMSQIIPNTNLTVNPLNPSSSTNSSNTSTYNNQPSYATHVHPNGTTSIPQSLPAPPQFTTSQIVPSNSTSIAAPSGPIPYLSTTATTTPAATTTIPINNTTAATTTNLPLQQTLSHSHGMQAPQSSRMGGFPTIPARHPATSAGTTVGGGGGGGGGADGQRSVSLPDFSTYTSKVNDEEVKRVKRLARNRASARLRRLRKKNLVENYESEVGVLESSLAKLRAHRWGVGNDPEALLEALSMDRGQQTIDSAKRKELITSILTQQREQVRNVMDCQLENMVLGFLARHGGSDDGDGDGGGDKHGSGDGDGGTGISDAGVEANAALKIKVEDETGDTSSDMDTTGCGEQQPQQSQTDQQQQLPQTGQSQDTKEERRRSLDALASELNDLLCLTPSQKSSLIKATEGIEEERRSIEIVDASLEAMLSNGWLMNEGVEACTEEFTSILNASQMSKFLLWADHNTEAIDGLDYVNAPGAGEQPSRSPMFVFGVDEGSVADEN